MPALDRYDPAILDDDEYDDLSQTERLAAEEAMRRRDKEAGILRRDDREIFYDMSDEEEVCKFNCLINFVIPFQHKNCGIMNAICLISSF